MNLTSLGTLLGTSALLTSGTLAQEVIFTDDFDDNTITGWTFFDRNGAEEIANANWVETEGRLEQQTANYDFPRGTNDAPSLGTIALAPQKVGGHYRITTTLTSLEPGNEFQDEDIVFGYVDPDTFFYIETIPNRVVLFQVLDGDRLQVASGTLTFSHEPIEVSLEHNAEAGQVIVTYGEDPPQEFLDPAFIREGENSVGVGSNNDAFAIDDFSIASISPIAPAELKITSLVRNSETKENTLTFTSQAGADYFIDKSTDLINWSEVDDTTGEPGTTTFIDTTEDEKVFYRIRTS